jgi:hypothetical protein
MATIEVIDGENLPSLGLFVRENGTLLTGVDAGHTFELKVADDQGTVVFTKTTGITGQTGSGVPPSGTPNVVVQWASGTSELAGLTGGDTYQAQLKITRTTDSRSRYYQFSLYCRAAL